MPIVFEQAAPMAPQTSIDAGRAEIATHDLPTLASLYESNQRNELSASSAQASLSAQAQAAHANAFNQATAYGQQNDQRNREFAASQQPSDRDVYLANVQAASVQQHAQLQSWLSQQELSQQEGMRLQRLQNAIGDVQARTDLDDGTKMDLITQLKSGIDPLKQRLEASKAKLEQEQQQKIMHANAQQESMANMDAAGRSAAFAKRVVTMPNPVTGQPEQFYTDHKGDLQPVPFGGGKAGHAAEGVQEKEYHATRLAAQKRLDGLIATTEKELMAANKADSWASAEDKKRLSDRLNDLRTNEQTYLRNDLNNAGLGYNWEEHQQRRSGNGQQPSPGSQPQQPLEPKPWPEDQKNWTGEHRAKAAAFTDAWDKIDRAPMSDEQKMEAQAAIGEIAQMIRKSGDVSRLTPKQKEKYDMLMKKAVENLPVQSPNQPPPGSPPPQHQPTWWERNMKGTGGKTFILNSMIGSGQNE